MNNRSVFVAVFLLLLAFALVYQHRVKAYIQAKT